MGLSSTELMELGETKKGDFFFTNPSCFTFFLTCAQGYQCLNILRYRHQDWHLNIVIFTSKQSQMTSVVWLHPKHVEPLYPGVIRKCQNCAAVIYWSIREEAYELLLLLSCKSIAYENVDSMICMCIWIMLNNCCFESSRGILWLLPRYPKEHMWDINIINNDCDIFNQNFLPNPCTCQLMEEIPCVGNVRISDFVVIWIIIVNMVSRDT